MRIYDFINFNIFIVKNFPHGPNDCLFERKENLINHYTNTECNREIENESIENTRQKIENPSRTPRNAASHHQGAPLVGKPWTRTINIINQCSS